MSERAGVAIGVCMVVLAVLACGDPVVAIWATTVDSTGAPIAGVKATMTCAGGISETATSDADGKVNFGGVGTPSKYDKCTVAFDKPGLRPASVAAPSLCVRSSSQGNYGKACTPAEGRVTLSP
jgi:hypothetical protein